MNEPNENQTGFGTGYKVEHSGLEPYVPKQEKEEPLDVPVEAEVPATVAIEPKSPTEVTQ